MIQDSYIIYRSDKAAEEMFRAMKLVNNKMSFTDLTYVDEETATAHLNIALMKRALKAKA